MSRSSLRCILPPYVLEAVQRNGTPEDRSLISSTLAIDRAVRSLRAATPVGAAGPGLDGMAAKKTRRTIYDAHGKQALPGTLVRAEGGPPSSDIAVNEAYDGLGATLDFYAAAYARNSVDDAGLDLLATVHFGRSYDNAMWDGTQMIFGDGDGTLFNRFTASIDVIGHELTHGVTQYEANLAYTGQSGALNESLSDVFGSLIKQYAASPRQTAAEADWLIGQGLLASSVHGVALRSMKAPGTAFDDPVLGKDPQPATMAGYLKTTSDNGGVHTNSGIPNHAFYLAAVAFGGAAWEKAGQVWYDALCDTADLSSDASFADFAKLTAAKAQASLGADGRTTVVDAWRQVGVDASS